MEEIGGLPESMRTIKAQLLFGAHFMYNESCRGVQGASKETYAYQLQSRMRHNDPQKNWVRLSP